MLSRAIKAYLVGSMGFPLFLDSSSGVVQRCALDGTPIDSLPVPVNRFYYMTIHDSVVHTVDYGVQPTTFSRLTLRTRSFMPDVLGTPR